MKDFLENLVKSIVENPDKVEIKEDVAENKLHTYTIVVADEDMGRVIGKSGKVINAIRTLMKVMAIRQGVRARVDLHDTAVRTEPGDMGSGEQHPQETVEEAPVEPEESTEEVSVEAEEPSDEKSPSDLVNPPTE